PERAGGDALFVVEHLAVGEASVAVDGGVHVAVADLVRTDPLAWVAGTAHPPTTTLRDATELLHVHVHQLAQIARRDPADDLTGRAVHPRQAVHAESHQHAVNRRCGHT